VRQFSFCNSIPSLLFSLIRLVIEVNCTFQSVDKKYVLYARFCSYVL
jgi:hypothetical protein